MKISDNKLAEFAHALEQQQHQQIELKLFIAGMGTRSTRAMCHAQELCDLLGDRCKVEVVDIYDKPGAASESQVVAVPALVRNSPRPLRRVIGSIADTLDTARRLGLLAPAEANGP